MPETINRFRKFLTPEFVVAVAILATAAAISGPVARALSLRRMKEPLPLRNPLAMLDQLAVGGLGPYRLCPTPTSVTGKTMLDATSVENLGTADYIMWSLEDTSVPQDSPVRFLQLFITYYTGGNDLVPHTPDACYTGSGYSLIAASTKEVPVPLLESGTSPVPVRLCTFQKTGVMDRDQFHVLYMFYCNGDFVAGRTDVRVRVNNLTNHYAFFSKVEVKYPRANEHESLEAVSRLFEHLLPTLIEKHWPDYEAAESAADEKP